MKYKKYQAGGMIYVPTPFANTTEQTVGASPSQSTSSSSNKITGTYAKEIADLIKQDGLPSDVNYFLKTVNNVLSSASTFGHSLLTGSPSEFSMADLIKVQSLASNVKYNHDVYKNTISQINQNKTGSEVAIDNSGNMFVTDAETGNIGQISINTYDKNKDKYIPMTNGDIINQRARNNNLALNSSLLNNLEVVENTNSIAKYVGERIAQFGTKEINEATKKGIPANVIKGAEILIANGADGFYKITKEEEVQDARAALKFIIGTLTPAQNARLRVNAAVMGKNPDDITDIYDSIISALDINTNNSLDINYNAAKTKSVKAIGSSSGGSTALGEHPRAAKIAEGSMTADHYKVAIVPHASQIGSQYALYTTGVHNGRLQDKEQQVGDMTLNQLKSITDLQGGVFNSGSVVFGNKILTGADFDKIVYDSDYESNTVYLPYKEVNGQIVPDLDKVYKVKEFVTWLNNSGKNATIQEKNMELRKRNLDPNNFDYKTNTYNIRDQKQFIQFVAIAGKNTADLTMEDKTWLEQLEPEEAKQKRKEYNNFTHYDTATPSKDQKKLDRGFGDTTGKNKFYRGNVFVYARPVQAWGYAPDYMPKSEMNDYGRRVLAREIATDVAASGEENKTINAQFIEE